MFHRSNKNISPIIPADTPEAQKVLETLESAPDINPETVVLVGSAALALLGVTLSSDALNRDKPRPGDVDLTASVSEMNRQYASESFELVKDELGNHQTILRTTATSPLPLELISRADRGHARDLQAHDEGFLKFWNKHSAPIEDSDFRIITPDLLQKRLKSDAIDPKYRADYQNLQAWRAANKR